MVGNRNTVRKSLFNDYSDLSKESYYNNSKKLTTHATISHNAIKFGALIILIAVVTMSK